MDQIIIYLIVGFLAQLVDGALGMAYGVSATTLLVSSGVPPAAASASVHLSKIVTSGVSGFAHFRFGNVDAQLMKRIGIPGVIGAILGALLLSTFPGKSVVGFVALYLLGMGGLILYKAFSKPTPRPVATNLVPLGFAGGFLDAVGGGGWGPVVTSTLLARGNDFRFTIGSVNAAEFFVAIAASLAFVVSTSTWYWQPVIGLSIGGAIAAPMAAYLTQKINVRALMIVVGTLIIALNLRTLFQILGS